MKLQAGRGAFAAGAEPVGMICPACGHKGTFDVWIGDWAATQGAVLHWGFRRCPNPKCHAIVLVIMEAQTVTETYPPLRLPFDSTGIPPKVIAAFDEALSAHANRMWMSAGMMVRKTIEELCADQQAEGPTLQARIAALATKIVIPKALVDGMDHLRLLGNDATHTEIRHFQTVSSAEIEVAIDLITAILHATYQYSALLNKITSLRVPGKPGPEAG